MQQLNLPSYELKIKQVESQTYVWDEFRRKFIVLTPEEHVRQIFAKYLVKEKKWPKGRVGVEISLKFNKLTKRADIVIYGKDSSAEMIVECKAAKVKITPQTFEQIARYNMNFRAKILVVTNGLTHYCCIPNYETNEYVFVKEIPEYEDS